MSAQIKIESIGNFSYLPDLQYCANINDANITANISESKS